MSPNEQAVQVLNQLRDHLLKRLASRLDARQPGRLIIGLAGGAENRGLRLQGIDLLERPQDRKHEIGVVNRVRDRLGKGLPE